MDGEGSNSCEAEPVEAQRDDHDEFEAVPSTVDDFDMLRKSLSNLKDIAGKNAHYFGSRPNYNQSQEKFHTLFTNIATSAESTELLCEPLIAGCAVFDGTPYTHANGFRSLLQMVTAVVSGLISQSQFCEANCASPFFFSGTALELLRSQLDALKGMSRLIILAQDLMNTLVNGDLFPESQAVSEDLLTQSQNIPRDCFYGHCLGIHVSLWACHELIVPVRIKCCMAALAIEVPESLFPSKYARHSRTLRLLHTLSQCTFCELNFSFAVSFAIGSLLVALSLYIQSCKCTYLHLIPFLLSSMCPPLSRWCRAFLLPWHRTAKASFATRTRTRGVPALQTPCVSPCLPSGTGQASC